MRVALIRHPKPGIEAGICYGRLDIPPHPSTEQQVARIAADPMLRGATWVWTSPARRCQVLANAIARTLAVPLTADPRLQELDFGDWEGQPWDTVPQGDLDRWAAAPSGFAPPNGESGSALVERVRNFHATLNKDGKDCVVVSHGGPLKVLTALLVGRAADLLAPPPPMGDIRILQAGSQAAERGK